MEITEKHLKLYACCVPVKGYQRSTICDLQRHKLDIIPNDLYEIILLLEDKNVQELFELYGLENKETLESYFNFLIENDYAFYTNTPERFPKMDLSFERPEVITNAIIDSNGLVQHDYSKIFNQLTSLGCKYIQLRFFSILQIELLENILSLLSNSIIKSVEVILQYDSSMAHEKYVDLCNKFPRIYMLTISNSPYQKIYKGKKDVMTDTGTIIYTKENITDESHCGIIDPSLFVFNVDTFSESQRFNTCLNKKISIDTEGEIKNCPSMLLTYGNIRNKSIEDIASDDGFQSYWHMKKDDIDDCKVCEFRHVCTDCRAYTIDHEKGLGKPKKCKYDPYKAEWPL